MPRFAITETAGRIVAGHTNIGVGSVLTISDAEAADALKSGHLVALDAKGARKRRGKEVSETVLTDPEQDNSDQSALEQ
jgi:hypothetical protein